MQPPRMALTTSGGPGNTNNNCVANALENTKGHKEHNIGHFRDTSTLNWPFSATTGPKIKASGASCSEIVQIIMFSSTNIH